MHARTAAETLNQTKSGQQDSSFVILSTHPKKSFRASFLQPTFSKNAQLATLIAEYLYRNSSWLNQILEYEKVFPPQICEE